MMYRKLQKKTKVEIRKNLRKKSIRIITICFDNSNSSRYFHDKYGSITKLSGRAHRIIIKLSGIGRWGKGNYLKMKKNRKVSR